MSDIPHDDDAERRARIDLMLLDIEHRIQQIQATRGQIPQLAADTEVKRDEHRLSDRRFVVSCIAAAATLIAAGGGLFAAGAAIWRQPAPIVIQMPASQR